MLLQSCQFWENFREEVVVKECWKTLLPIKSLLAYRSEPVVTDRMIVRRQKAHRLFSEGQWSVTIYEACRQIANGQDGTSVTKIREADLLNPLLDFMEHTRYFLQVQKAMVERGERVFVLGHGGGCIHDVDKLDPVMLVAYAERFDDTLDTILWQKCVDNHIQTSPHHQGQALWNWDELATCQEHKMAACVYCEGLRHVVLREMICDKVSRKLQKDLGGIMAPEMWDVDLKWFAGLPDHWLRLAETILRGMKSAD